MKNIAVLTAGLDVNHAHRIVQGVNECAEENDANVFVFTCRRRYNKNIEYDEGEYNIYNLPDFNDFDGAILVNSTVGCEEVLLEMTRRIEEAQIPTVGIERDDLEMFNICIDNRSAMREMVEHLITVHGFTKINFITGSMTNQEACERLEAYKDVLNKYHIPIETSRIYYGDFLKATGVLAAETFIANKEKIPQAIVASNDIMAIGAYDTLVQHGYRVPEDIAIVGFDDDYDARYHVPALSSVSRYQEEVGYAACDKVLFSTRKMAGKIVIPTKAHFRESCGCHEETNEDYLTFRKNHYELKRNNELYMDITQSMSAELTGVESFDQLRDYMRRFFLQIECKAMYLFICDDFSDIDKATDIYQEGKSIPDYVSRPYSENDFLLLGYEDKQFIEGNIKGFKDFVNRVRNLGWTKNVYVVSPIHYRNRNFGYFIICNSDFPYDNQIYYSWLTNIGNAVETIRKQKQLQSMITKLDSVWSFDTLTKTYNRSGFRKYGMRIWEEGMKNDGVLILFMDLDSLKKVNDTYGHEEGDRYIQTFAQILKQINKHDGDIVMRYGGDEFVYMATVTKQKTGEYYQQQIQEALENCNRENCFEYKVDASIGCHVVTRDSNMSLEQAIEKADSQMYMAKKKKKTIKILDKESSVYQ